MINFVDILVFHIASNPRRWNPGNFFSDASDQMGLFYYVFCLTIVF